MLKPPIDQSPAAATAEAYRLYAFAAIYALAGAAAWIATGRRIARATKEN